MISKRGKAPADLMTVTVPAAQAGVVQRQIAPIVQLRVRQFSPHLTVREQMEQVAFDCYMQGLIHGYQVGGGRL